MKVRKELALQHTWMWQNIFRLSMSPAAWIGNISTDPRRLYQARGTKPQIFVAQRNHRHVAGEEERLQWEDQ